MCCTNEPLVYNHSGFNGFVLVFFLSDSVCGVRGGALVSVLHAQSYHGDPSVRQKAERLTGAAAQPLFQMIREWVTQGELDDPMVSEKDVFSSECGSLTLLVFFMILALSWCTV